MLKGGAPFAAGTAKATTAVGPTLSGTAHFGKTPDGKTIDVTCGMHKK